MIARVRGDLFESEVEALVNPVNCVGVMGAGLAKEFKRRFPDMFELYAAVCRRGDLRPGELYVYPTGSPFPPAYIINVPTKDHWHDPSTIEIVRAGVLALARAVWQRDIRSIAVPALGCGLGGLAWEEVAVAVEEAFLGLPEVRVLLYEPGDQCCT